MVRNILALNSWNFALWFVLRSEPMQTLRRLPGSAMRLLNRHKRVLVATAFALGLGLVVAGGYVLRSRHRDNLSQHAMSLARRDGARATMTTAWNMVWVDLDGGELTMETARAFVNATQVTDLTTSPPPSQDVQLLLSEAFDSEGQRPDPTILSWIRSTE